MINISLCLTKVKRLLFLTLLLLIFSSCNGYANAVVENNGNIGGDKLTHLARIDELSVEITEMRKMDIIVCTDFNEKESLTFTLDKLNKNSEKQWQYSIKYFDNEQYAFIYDTHNQMVTFEDVLESLVTNETNLSDDYVYFKLSDGETIIAFDKDRIIMNRSNVVFYTNNLDVLVKVQNVMIENVELKDEVVTIRNTNNSLDLSGWTLVSEVGGETYEFPKGYIFKADSIIKVVSGRGKIGNGDDILKWTGSYIWNNKGDSCSLYDDKGILIDRYE